MNKGEPVSVRQAANGFLVEDLGIRDGQMIDFASEVFLFNHFKDMTCWMQEHFPLAKEGQSAEG